MTDIKLTLQASDTIRDVVTCINSSTREDGAKIAGEYAYKMAKWNGVMTTHALKTHLMRLRVQGAKFYVYSAMEYVLELVLQQLVVLSKTERGK